MSPPSPTLATHVATGKLCRGHVSGRPSWRLQNPRRLNSQPTLQLIDLTIPFLQHGAESGVQVQPVESPPEVVEHAVNAHERHKQRAADLPLE